MFCPENSEVEPFSTQVLEVSNVPFLKVKMDN